MNDLKEAMFKYASNKGYWRPEIKLSFNLATTTAVFKDRQVIPVIGKCRHHFNLTIQKASAVKTGTIN